MPTARSASPLARFRAVVARRLRRAGLQRKGWRLARRRGPVPPVLRGGLVEQIRADLVAGWVSVPPGTRAVAVRLRLNDRVLITTKASLPAERSDPGGDVRRFRLTLRDLPRYLGPTDVLTVEAAGTALPLHGYGMRYSPAVAGDFVSDELWRQLDNGYVLSRNGELQRPKTDDRQWQREVTYLARHVQVFVAEHFGYDVFFTYGTLLGAVREGGFIGHDDDLDLGYLSRSTDGTKIGPELRDIALALIDAGWIVEGFTTHLHVMKEFDGRMERVDLFAHYFDDGGLLRFPWGQAGTSHVRVEQWGGVHAVPFAGSTAQVPVCAEAVLEQLYGPGWREPQPGFDWKTDRTERAEDALMARDHCDEVYWADWHRRFRSDGPSRLFTTVSRRPELPDVVADVGCGDGRDTLAFAASGRTVFAVDRSDAALSVLHAGLAAADPQVAARVVVCRADVKTTEFAEVLDRVVTAAGDRAVLFYLRFLIHAWHPAQEKPVLDALRAYARPGDLFVAEFRSKRDKALPKRHLKAFRVYRDGVELAERLRYEYAMTVLQADRAVGRSPYGEEDPDLFRIVGRFGDRPAATGP